jgi:electron transfer flavoprotein beta subunit
VSAVRILVCFTVTPDYEARRASDWAAATTEGVETRYVRRILNCFDESALELALRARESFAALGVAAALDALTIGGREADPHLATARALGYERAVRVDAEDRLDFAPGVTASLIAGYLRRTGGCDLLLLGTRTGPGDGGTVPFRLAEQLGLPCLSQVTAFEPLDGRRLRVSRAVGGGLVHATVSLPCVLSVGNAIVSHLRVPTLSERLAARAHDTELLAPADLGVDVAAELGREMCALTGLEAVRRERGGAIVRGRDPREKARALLDALPKGLVEGL